jgi:hypothetical protein
MTIQSVFTRDNIGVEGLSPLISIEEIATKIVVVSNASMVEVNKGLYIYDFVGFDSAKEYYIISDAQDITLDGQGKQYSGNGMYSDSFATLIANKVKEDINLDEQFNLYPGE